MDLRSKHVNGLIGYDIALRSVRGGSNSRSQSLIGFHLREAGSRGGNSSINMRDGIRIFPSQVRRPDMDELREDSEVLFDSHNQSPGADLQIKPGSKGIGHAWRNRTQK
jgi:hypothetical protein